jgi:hypothetical protein
MHTGGGRARIQKPLPTVGVPISDVRFDRVDARGSLNDLLDVLDAEIKRNGGKTFLYGAGEAFWYGDTRIRMRDCTYKEALDRFAEQLEVSYIDNDYHQRIDVYETPYKAFEFFRRNDAYREYYPFYSMFGPPAFIPPSMRSGPFKQFALGVIVKFPQDLNASKYSKKSAIK